MVETLLQKEVQKGPKMTGQQGLQEQVSGGYRTRGQLLELAHEESIP